MVYVREGVTSIFGRKKSNAEHAYIYLCIDCDAE